MSESSKPTQPVGLSTNRIEAFSDGVFAIAITLLILEVRVPQLHAGESLLYALFSVWPKLLAYAVSFAVIGIFWIGHHIMFHYIKRSDRTLLWLNTMLLMFISAIPFAAALIGEYRTEPVAAAFYGLLLCIDGLVFYGVWAYASHDRRLTSPTLSPEIISLAKKAILVAPIVYAVAAGVAFINPLISDALYLLVPLAYLVPSPIDRLVAFNDTLSD